jgi:hypothetical protein
MNEAISEVAVGDTIREIRFAATAVRESSAKIASVVEKASDTAVSAAYFVGVRDGCIVSAIVLVLFYLVTSHCKR